MVRPPTAAIRDLLVFSGWVWGLGEILDRASKQAKTTQELDFPGLGGYFGEYAR